MGLECGWGLAGFDLVGAVSSIPSSASTQDRTSVWYDVTGLLQRCFKWGCLHVGKTSYSIMCVNFYCMYPFIRVRDSSVGIATGYGLDSSGIESWWG
jgi:hypothetical protein